MNLNDLKYLIALADHQHFGKAAKAACVSQPGLSMQIKKLEEYLGVQLIERKHKKFMFTPIGQTVVMHARNIMSNVDAIKNATGESKDPFCGEFTLGIIPTLAPYLLPIIMPHILKIFPKLNIFLIEGQTKNLLKKLHLGELDAAILALPILENNLYHLPLFEEEFLLMLSDKNKLIKKKKLNLDDIKQQSILLLEDGHCLRSQTLSVCELAKAEEAKRFEATSLETLRQMVANDLGITLIPKLAEQESDRIRYLSFVNPKPSRKLALFGRISSYKQQVLKKLADEIQKVLRKDKRVKVLYM